MTVHDLVATHVSRTSRPQALSSSAEERYYRDHDTSRTLRGLQLNMSVTVVLVLILAVVA